MKRFLFSLILALTILLPITTAVEAADIPDVRQISPSNIKPDNSAFNKDHSVYVYVCKNGNYYAAQFVQMLTKNYPFKVVDRFDDNEYPEWYEWYLVYTGSKKVMSIREWSIREWGNCHVVISSSNNDIEIRIGKGLTYAGHFITDDMGNIVGY